MLVRFPIEMHENLRVTIEWGKVSFSRRPVTTCDDSIGERLEGAYCNRMVYTGLFLTLADMPRYRNELLCGIFQTKNHRNDINARAHTDLAVCGST